MRSTHLAMAAISLGTASAGSWWPPFAAKGHDSNDYCPPCGVGPVRSDRRCVQCHNNVCVTTTETMMETTTLMCQQPAQTTTIAVTVPCSSRAGACTTTTVEVAVPAPSPTQAPCQTDTEIEDDPPCTSMHAPSPGCACYTTVAPALEGMSAGDAKESSGGDGSADEPYGAGSAPNTPYGAAGGSESQSGSAPVSTECTCSTAAETSWTYTPTGEWTGTTTGVWMPSSSVEEPVWSSTETGPMPTSSTCMYNLTQPAYANVSEIFTLANDSLQAAEAEAARRFCDAVGGGVYCYSPLACQSSPGQPEAQPNANAPCLPTAMISCPDAVFMACKPWSACVQRDLRFAAQCVAVADAVGPELAALNPTPAIRVRDERPVLLLTTVVTETLPATAAYAPRASYGTADAYGTASGAAAGAVTTYTTTSVWVPTYCGGPNPPLLQAWMHSLSMVAATLDNGMPSASDTYFTGTTMPTTTAQSAASPVCTVY